MPTPRKPPKRSKHPATTTSSSTTTTTTPSDHLAHCISLEESGDKWRAGDAAKAARFYVRAIEGYEEGLRRWGPAEREQRAGEGGGDGGAGFDMAYNLARIQYHITQYAAVSAQFPAPLQQQLRTALASHRRALLLDPSNADVLFNTAQVLTSLAEAVQDDDEEGQGQDPNSNSSSGAGAALEEAVGLFERCLALQGMSFERNVQQMVEAQSREMDAVDEEIEDTSNGEEIGAGVEEGRWASVIEPVTKQSLQDTAMALLDTLGTWAMALPLQDHAGLNHVENIGQALLADKLHVYLEGADEDAKTLAWLTVAKFKATVSEAEFKHGVIDVQTYDQRLKDTFEDSAGREGLLTMMQTSGFLCCYADALIAFAAAVAQQPGTAVLRWTRLSKALECLTQASKIPRVADLATLHVGRGDVEMLRHMLCNTSDLPENLSNGKIQTTLLKNAEVYYRGASSLAQSSMRRSQGDIYDEASVKRAVVASMLGETNAPLIQLRTVGIVDSSMKKVLQEMVDESLVLEDRMKAFL